MKLEVFAASKAGSHLDEADSTQNLQEAQSFHVLEDKENYSELEKNDMKCLTEQLSSVKELKQEILSKKSDKILKIFQ